MSKIVRQIKQEFDKIPNKSTQRAVIFQGGGPIGAYAAGVYAVLYHWVKKDIVGDENVFDIVAGTSAGAINASIIVSHVIHTENHDKLSRWKGSVQKVLDFWHHTSSSPDFTKWKPFFSYAWPFFNNEDAWISVWDATRSDNKATGEAARRYYSAKEFLYSGAPRVFSHYPKENDERFYDNFWPVTNEWYRYNNDELKQSIRKYTHFPIRTKEKNEPRLLIVAVDVQEGEQVTFDSHLSRVDFGYNEEGKTTAHIEYKHGLMAEHVMASASVPVHYDYAIVPETFDYDKSETEMESESTTLSMSNHRRFWDGGILSNTPLTEVIQAHRDSKDFPPAPLKVYIVDVWPSVKKYLVATDHDGVINRKNDLIYQDKTFYEEKVTHLISDYKTLVDEIRKLVEQNNLQIDEILNRKTPKSRNRDGSERTYRKLIDTVFDIDITRIERTPDKNEISFKWCDYSIESINCLIRQGVTDTLKALVKDFLQSNHNSKIVGEVELFINSVECERQDKHLDKNHATLLMDEAKPLTLLNPC
ncbi:MAG TPA: patatin-like phospholipase family protein [Nitrososphaeraceae archaeon]|nr:patatin-like phospholipase family protein [Nitrososphaeraceae archaeon]